MNIFTKYLQFILLGTSLMACSQIENRVNQNSKITVDNIADEIFKQVKHYPIEPMYVISHEGNYYNSKQ